MATDREIILQDRIEMLEALLGADRSSAGRLREALNLEPLWAQMLGMLYARDFVTRDGLYTVLYEGRPECEWPDEKILDVQFSKLRKFLRLHGNQALADAILTRWGEGWSLTRAGKAIIAAALRKPDAGALAVVTDAPPLAPAGMQAKTLKERRLAFLDGQ